MPDVSIAIAATDRYSSTIKTIQSVTRAFSKDAESLQQKLSALDKTKATLKVDTDQARKRLGEAQKSFSSAREQVNQLQSAVDNFSGDQMGEEFADLKKQLGEANEAFRDSKDALGAASEAYEGAYRNLQLVGKETRNTQKELENLDSSVKRKNGFNQFADTLKTVAISGGAKFIGDTLSQVAAIRIGSAFDSETGTLISSTLSGIGSGAGIGMSIGGIPGALIGGVIGAGFGALGGAAQNFSDKDDAFKSYVQDQYDTGTQNQSDSLTSGSAIAGSREQDMVAFTQRFGSEIAAQGFLDQVKEMAVNTNYAYDEITGYSKTLLNSYSAEETLGVLQDLSDATAGLNLDSSGVSMFIAGLSRMRTTGKATQEYLNYFSERGLDVYEALAQGESAARGESVDRGQIMEMVSRGEIGGADAAEYILSYIQETFGGLSEKMAGTYNAMADNLGDVKNDLNAAMGEGYNAVRTEGMQQEIDFYTGEAGDAMKEAYNMIGQWQASLENLSEEMARDSLSAVMTGVISDNYRDTEGQLKESGQRLQEMAEEYQQLLTEYEAGSEEAGAKMGSLLAEAQAIAANEYNASEGYQLQQQSQLDLADKLQEDANLQESYWNAGYVMGQKFSEGMINATLSARSQMVPIVLDDSDPESWIDSGYFSGGAIRQEMQGGGYAVGLQRVPYDGFPALLHEGERVLTASEARAADSAGSASVTVSGNTFVVRQESDIDAIAEALAEKLLIARRASGL